MRPLYRKPRLPDLLLVGAICDASVRRVAHNFDQHGLKRELIAGCLIEKGGGEIYFGHRSIQEFLAAEYLFETDMLARADLDLWPDSVLQICTHAGPEVSQFF